MRNSSWCNILSPQLVGEKLIFLLNQAMNFWVLATLQPLGLPPLEGYVSLASPRDAVSLSRGVTEGRLSPFRAPHHGICFSPRRGVTGLSQAVFAVWAWQANDKVSHRGEDLGRMMGGACCHLASFHSSDFFVPALGGQIPQEISDSACGRIKAASLPGFESDVWILWHRDNVRIFH